VARRHGRLRPRTESPSCRPPLARKAGGYDLVVLDGPALPWEAADRKLLDLANGVVAVLPVNLDINDAMEDIIASLGPAQQKLAGVILNELTPPTQAQQRSRQYA
jgi:hypothetical protein